CVGHGPARGEGELYDLEADPGEFENLWDSPDHADLKTDLLLRCFDQAVFTADPWPPRTGAF
ncbi:MAG: sulfatase, partial [Planctomycetes bacterium]|nr:sulfatase [Planctomycetota bacterium]